MLSLDKRKCIELKFNRIGENTPFTATVSETISEIIRGIRLHFPNYIKSKVTHLILRAQRLRLVQGSTRSGTSVLKRKMHARC